MLVPMVGLIALGCSGIRRLAAIAQRRHPPRAGAARVLCLIPAARLPSGRRPLPVPERRRANARLVGGPGIMSGSGSPGPLRRRRRRPARVRAVALRAPAAVNLAIHRARPTSPTRLGSPAATGPGARQTARPGRCISWATAARYYADAGRAHLAGPLPPAWDSSPLGDAIRQNPAVAGGIDPLATGLRCSDRPPRRASGISSSS